MRIAINLLFVLLAAFLAYMLYGTIKEPVKFQAEKDLRETAVVDKLIKIRKAQEYYRAITGEFAPNFDTLKQVLNTGNFTITKVEGDPDDPDGGKVVYTEIEKSAKDSLASLNFTFNDLETIPYTNVMTFDIEADTTTYQNTLVHVVQVGTKRSNFMGEFADPRFAKYDDSYDPNAIIKFGDMSKPNTSGNWE